MSAGKHVSFFSWFKIQNIRQ